MTPRTKKQACLQIGIIIQSVSALLGSLYYSNFGEPFKNIADGMLFHGDGGLEPCHLCWWARILIYPMVLVSLIGYLKKDNRFTDYILAMSIPGMILTAYHYSLQKLTAPSFFECGAGNSCTATQAVDYFGFITIPFLAFTACTVITLLAIANTVIEHKKNKMLSVLD